MYTGHKASSYCMFIYVAHTLLENVMGWFSSPIQVLFPEKTQNSKYRKVEL